MSGDPVLTVEPADTPDAAHCLQSYYDELAARFDNGFDARAGNNFDPAEMTPPKGWFVVARIDGRAVGCGALKRLSDGEGEIKRVWTNGSVRGTGIAGRIMDYLEGLAGEQGFVLLRLDTNGQLSEAQTMYARRGYVETAPYNDNPYADHWYAKALQPSASGLPGR